MRPQKYIPIVLAVLVALIALAFILLAFQPYVTLKAMANSIDPNRDFRSLKEGNAIVFKILLGVAGVVFFSLAYVIAFGHLKQVRGWLGQYWADFTHFMKTLRPARLEAGTLAALTLIVILAAVFRLVHIYDLMSHDESYTFVVFSSGSLFNTVTNYHLPNNHILNSILIYFSTHLLGLQPWAVRLPALLAGLLLVPLSYALAKSIYDRVTALASALLVAVLPGAILYSTAARGYSLVALFTLLALWLAIYLREERNLFAWSMLVLFSALGFYSVPVMLIPFGMVFAWLFFENLVRGPGPYGSKIDFLKYWLVAGFSSAVLVLLLYTPVFIYSGADKVFANHWVLPEAWAGYIGSIPGRAVAVWQEWTGGLPPVLSYLLLAGFLLSVVFHRRLARQRFPLQIAAFVWIVALLLLQRPEGVTKIWAFLQAPFMIWAAAGTVGLLRDLRLKFARNLPVAALVLGAALAITLVKAVQVVPTIPQRWADKEAPQKTALFIKDQLGPQDLVIIDSPFDAAVWYYSRLCGIPDSRFDNRLPFEHLFVIVSRGDHQTVESVLQDRGPDPALVDTGAARLIMNYQYLDTYEVPHR